MDTARIAELLQPFLATPSPTPPEFGDPVNSNKDDIITQNKLRDIATYIDLLLRWNARINLTAIRHPEEIVTRHFGESLFAARHLFPESTCRRERPRSCGPVETLIDIGSGAGFPGLPMKMWAPEIHLTLIEANQKKATFLREVIRTLTLTNVNVFQGRAEAYPDPPAEVVTLRAVEHFDTTLPIAASLVAPHGRLALLTSMPHLARAQGLTARFTWRPPIPLPLSSTRVLAIGIHEP